MATSDPVADMLTKMRNASAAKHAHVDVFPSGLKTKVLKILKSEGYIGSYKKVVKEGKTVIRIALKYDDQERPVIHGIKRISKPGRRIYSGYDTMPRVFNGHGIVVVSTSSGVITGKKATEQKVGGELICSVW